MSDWVLKRFWNNVTVEQCHEGWRVLLDMRPVRTPATGHLAVPTRALAEGIATEWAAQDQIVVPVSMPLTRAANTAIDKISQQHKETVDLLSAYGESDLLCYRAEGPDALVRRQTDVWDPLLDWADAQFGARLKITTGLCPIAQSPEVLCALREPITRLDHFALTALYDFVTLSGSLVIGLAAQAEAFALDNLWEASRIDEIWQASQWGEDMEATQGALNRRNAFFQAAEFHSMLMV